MTTLTCLLNRTILHETGHSFSCQTEIPFTLPLHRHSDYELILITQGHGVEFIGDSVQAYRSGELMLIGAHVPHLHLCDSVTHPSVTEKSRCEILQFPHRLFPTEISDIQEYASIHQLLKRSAQGIKFTSKPLINKATDYLHQISRQRGMNRLILLLQLLDRLGKSQNFQLISPITYPNLPHTISNEPLAKVYDYLHRHFREDITLQILAEQIHTSPTSLCRTFKRATHTTPFEYLNRLRIEHACKLLTYSHLTISQIAYEIGFNNLAHFNRQFKRITQQTPSAYRQNILSEIPSLTVFS